jgi:hypothetical protein
LFQTVRTIYIYIYLYIYIYIFILYYWACTCYAYHVESSSYNFVSNAHHFQDYFLFYGNAMICWAFLNMFIRKNDWAIYVNTLHHLCINGQLQQKYLCIFRFSLWSVDTNFASTRATMFRLTKYSIYFTRMKNSEPILSFWILNLIWIPFFSDILSEM